MSTPFIDPEMQEIFDSFVVETQELLDSLTPDLMSLEEQSEDLDLLNRIFRSFHTIKGTSSFMGFDTITTITHAAEDLLNKLRRSELKVSLAIVDALLEVHDWIQLLMRNIQAGDNSPVDYSSTLNRLRELNDPNSPLHSGQDISAQPTALESVLNNKEISTGSGDFNDDELALIQAAFAEINQEFKNEFPAPEPDTVSGALKSVLDNKEITKGSGDFNDDELALIQAAFAEINQNFKSTPENDKTQTEIPDSSNKKVSAPESLQTVQVVEKAPPAISTPALAKPALPDIAKVTTPAHPAEKNTDTAQKMPVSSADSTIRVDVTRVETLMDLSGELVLGRNRLAQIAEKLQRQFENNDLVQELLQTTSQVDTVTSEIQSAVMKMRMIPIGKLYQKAPRIVRDLSKEFSKEIELVLKGEETEIDRGIIEELNDPLVHMIRNSCDHGIESPEEREKAGKPRRGRVILDAEQEGNNIVLRISDDGKGMDPEKLKAKAIEKGLITPQEAAQMSRRDAFQIIFLPGFSTAVKVSNVSGRGVGMDVVRTNIQKLKGVIDIESEIGKGSTFIIKLPLTLAIIQGLVVNVARETYAIPLASVIEVVGMDSENVYTMNQRQVIRIRQQVLPLLDLSEALNIENGISEEGQPKRNSYVVVVGLAQIRIGLVVHELLGQQEIVIKSLGSYLGQVRGIAGSTILGDGRVIMIIDVAEMVEHYYPEGLVIH
jgi:two-component system chemotaxis sensor kinase CheA